MKNILSPLSIPRIEMRALEAAAIAPIIQAVAERIGKAEALALLQEINEKAAFRHGLQLGQQLGQVGVAELVSEVASWCEGNDMQIEVLEQSETTYHFNVTRCPYFEKYREMGLLEYGQALSCCRDEAFGRGFSADLKLVRTQTIMEGADYCDFRYRFSSVSDE